jgi:hypothetical protein
MEYVLSRNAVARLYRVNNDSSSRRGASESPTSDLLPTCAVESSLLLGIYSTVERGKICPLHVGKPTKIQY